MKYINIDKPENCCGCRACENICPQNAIQMLENEEGFIYPKVNVEKCINCGLCKNICPWINSINRDKYLTQPICYAAKAKNLEIQKNSSSGGMFAILAEYIFEQNGIVVGSEMTKELKVKHSIAENKNELYKLMGSKYVFSDLNNIFKEIREHLESGKKVLFSGVPCQISALLNFLQKDYENLITVEVICHGAPSQKLFDKYISYLEKRLGGKILDYKFRSKKAASWGTFKALVKYEKNNKTYTKKINADFDKYYKNFLDSKGYRESCYECKFAKEERNADFTLGDFWGVEKVLPKMVDYNGVSEIILNTNKAVLIFNEIKKYIEHKEVDYEKLVEYNGQLEHPSKRCEDRDSWYKGIEEEDYFKKQTIKKDLRSYVKIFFPQKLKFKIKKYLKRK